MLLDVVMPGIDGYEVCRRLRADERTSFLPVVMVTASGEHEKRKAIEAGADDFVAKPFDHDELLARVRSLLRIKRYHDTIEARPAAAAFLSPQVADLVSGDAARSRATAPRSPCWPASCAISRLSRSRSSPRS